MLSRSAVFVAAASSALSTSCGDKASVSISMRIEAPTLAVERSSVGADATGGFSLVLALGSEAPDGTDVSLGAFSIRRNGADVLTPLSLSGSVSFPVRIGIGQSRTFPLTFMQSTDPSEAEVLCEDAPLFILGTVSDSASSDQPTSIQSAVFSADCAP